ncbi:Alpha/beta hydrolase fold-1 [Ilyonectria destructans]|nr:Alpha/beta hydrolase fold-1 [Ilyonectria destructans]
MPSKPTIVFIPGGWHGPDVWDKLTSLLRAQEYRCVSVELPSTLPDHNTTFSDDFNAARQCITAETTRGRDVVVVVHSYGGVVGSSAVKGLTRPKNPESEHAGPKQASHSHVIGIAMMASYFPPSGLSCIDALGGTPPPSWNINSEAGLAELTGDVRDFLYHDLSIDEGNLAVSRLRKHSLRSLSEGGEYVYSGWMDVPVWYLAARDDKAFPVEIQKAGVQIARDNGSDVTLREINTSHSPMLSKPMESVEFILEAVAYFQKGVSMPRATNL